MCASSYPPLTLDEWRGTRDAVHAYSRVLGKIRQALAPPRKHWFHITLHAGVTGLRTPPMVTRRHSSTTLQMPTGSGKR